MKDDNSTRNVQHISTQHELKFKEYHVYEAASQLSSTSITRIMLYIWSVIMKDSWAGLADFFDYENLNQSEYCITLGNNLKKNSELDFSPD